MAFGGISVHGHPRVLDKYRQACPVVLHALQNLGRGHGKLTVGQCLIAPGGQVMCVLLQAGVVRGVQGAVRVRLKAQPILMVTDRRWRRPTSSPTVIVGIAVGQFQEIPALMGLAKGQHECRMQPDELLVGRVTITTHNFPLRLGRFGDGDIGRTRRIQYIVNNRWGVKHPQVPAMSDLAFDVDKYHPAGLISMLVGFAAEFVRKRLVEWREQGVTVCKPPVSVPGDIVSP